MYLVSGLKKNLSVVELNLNSNGIGPEGIAKIFSLLEKNSSIVSLNLGSVKGFNRNRIDDRGADSLNAFLKNN